MKIIFEYDKNRKIEITTIAENIHDLMDEIERALIAYGFHPKTVKEGFLGKIEDYEEEK